jgi:inosine-uridine nucleoside N-ribohydrolase
MNRKINLFICINIFFCLFVGCTPAIEEPPAENTSTQVTNQTQEETSPLLTPLTSENIFSDIHGGKIPVIFSHGGGPCDIGAMVFLSKNPNVDWIGLVLSYGEFHPINALKKWPVFLYEVLGDHDVALGLGSETPLDPNGHEFPAEWRSSADDFWGLELPATNSTYEPAVGHELIIDLVNLSPKKVTLLVMGAQTDVALALMDDPGIADNIASIVIMGGAFNIRGNLNEGQESATNVTAEWNMYVDPQAAKVVFNSGVPLSIVPLDAVQYYVQSKDVNAMNTIDGPGVKYVAQMWDQQWGWSNGAGFFIWDTITATAVTNPENFTWVYDGVDVITEPGDFQGQTRALNNGMRNIRYAVSADYDAILDQLFNIYRGETTAVESDILISELEGTWEGFNGDFHITFILNASCNLNEKCGTFEIPEFSLTGDVAFVNITGNAYEFKVSNTSSGQPGNEYEYLQLLDDGTIKYSTTNLNVTSEAILHRK